ncbi:MAG: hypothetical protein ACPG8W_04445 [Candidatus Promineifilaceae bacterium]
MNDDSAQNIGVIGLISVSVMVVIFIVMMVIGLVLTLVMSGSVTTSAETTPTLVAQLTIEPPVTTTPVAKPIKEETGVKLLLTQAVQARAGRILVVSADQQLLTINPDGSGLRTLTQRSDRVGYSFPAWSPDNSQIAVIGDSPEGIYVLEDSAETTPQPIFTSDVRPIYLNWSPNSQQVSFISPSEGDLSVLNLNVVPSDGSADSRLMAFGAPFYWDWNSDGSELLFNTGGTSHADFAFLNMANGEIGEEIEAGAFFASPDISADDAYIAYSSGPRRSQRLVIADRGGVEQNSIQHVGLIAFAWSPVRNQLAYTTPRRATLSAYGGLWLVEATGEPRLMVDEDVITYYWSPDGSKIAYFTLADRGQSEQEVNQARTVLASDSPIRPIQDENNAQLNLSILEVATGETRVIGRFLPSELFIRQFIPFFDQYAHSHSLWSPDSRAMVMPVQENGVTIIYRFPADGSLPTKVIAGEIAFWSR